MENRIKKTELLAPAGSFESMKASVNAGADAVYMGGEMFGARAYAKNPDTKGMIEAIEFCHLRGKKLYLTINTLLKDDEIMDKLYGYILPFYEAGLDAVIVQDIGVMDFIGKYFPGLDIHVSTQCSLTMNYGIEGIKSYLENKTCIKRIVPARELSLEALKDLRKNTDLELEVFVHGALCYCYSGQCLFSSLAGGRSGNRGRCAQPCRKLYTTDLDGKKTQGYLLSPKDMCTLNDIHILMDLGIDSFKIEGRMKSPEYAAGVVSAYRRIMDIYYEKKYISGETREIDESLGVEELKELYNRGGFSRGYLFDKNGKDMMSTERPGHYGIYVGDVYSTDGRKAYIKLIKNVENGDVLELRSDSGDAVYEFTSGIRTEKNGIISVLTMKNRLPAVGMKVFRTKNQYLLNKISQAYIENDIKIPVDIKVSALLGKPLCVEASVNNVLSDKPVCIRHYGNIVEKAVKTSVSSDDIKKQMVKLGNTDFLARKVEIISDENVFIPVSELNRIRRETFDIFKKEILSLFERKNKCGFSYCKTVEKEEIKINENEQHVIFTAFLSDIDQLKWLNIYDKKHNVSEIYFEPADNNSISEAVSICEESLRKIFISLPRIAGKDNIEYIKRICEKYKSYVSGFLARNYEEIALLNEIGAEYRTDSNIYVFNSLSGKCHERVIKTGSAEKGYFIPNELNIGELQTLKDKNSEVTVYGLLPVMVSAQCVYKTITGECRKHGAVTMKDEKNFCFTDVADCRNCTNTIYNSSVLNVLYRVNDIMFRGFGRYNLRFTFENKEEIRLITECVEKVIAGGEYVFPDEIMGHKMTNGHFMRGVE